MIFVFCVLSEEYALDSFCVLGLLFQCRRDVFVNYAMKIMRSLFFLRKFEI